MRLAALSTVILCSLMLSVPVRAGVEDEIFAILGSFHHGEQDHRLPEPIRAVETLDLFYGERDYEPAWADYDFIERVLAELESSYHEGLNPEDYHVTALRRIAGQYLAGGERDTALRAEFDVLLSDAVLLYGRHLQEGKVDPSRIESTWNFSRRDFSPERLSGALVAALEAGTVVEVLQEFKPDVAFYQLLKLELARYRTLEQQYPVEPVPPGTTLRVGMTHPNVVPLRRQLERLGFATPATAAPETFDEALEAAVVRYQDLYGLGADGIVGQNSFAELNVSYSQRVEQIRLNMDRVRWVRDDLTEDLVLVNIAGYALYYFMNDKLAWTTDVMVGTIRTQTPIFHARMTYLEFNPTWTVPRSIIRRSLFPKFQADPGYVSAHNYKLFDSEGREVDPANLDWAGYSRGRFPYRVVQQPGPANALGRVKFMFPNKYAVYLHDTPSRTLFSRSARAFSAGCVRVKDPLRFADLLLDDNDQWDRARIEATVSMEQPSQQVVRFSKAVDVMLMYWTASPTPEGKVRLHPDVYNRDAKSLALLQETPRWESK